MSDNQIDLGFILLERAHAPDPAQLVEAASALGLTLTPEPSDKEGISCFRSASGKLAFVAIIDAPHPDAPTMPTGLLSPSAPEIASAKAHAIVTLMGDKKGAAPGGVESAQETAQMVAATCASTPAVAAMLGGGVTFHRAGAFQRAAAPDGNAIYVLVDVTVARESAERMSLLTHGLARFGREEFYITCSPDGGDSAIDFTYSMAGWMLADRDKVLPTGDTIGRTADEKLEIQRVDSPLDDGSTVIKLDMP